MLVLGSCQKTIDEVVASPTGKILPEATAPSSSSIENLGHVFTGTNVSWKLHPLDANNQPLFTNAPGQQGGHSLLMIDNGDVDGNTPITALKFVSVNFQNFTSKVIPVRKADGSAVTYSMGRIVRYIFGMDKKFYLATEGSPAGGGHLIQYDPNTQTAIDLGKPFKKNGYYLDIFSLNVGTDGALFAGSFGGDGEVMTLRYKDGVMDVNSTPLDNTSRYVVHVSGDSRYTYAVCGKNNWFLYAIDRTNGEKKLLMSHAGSSAPIELSTNTDAAYAQTGPTHYKLTGFTATSLGAYNRPASNRVYHVPYQLGDKSCPSVYWDGIDKKVHYKLSSGANGTIDVDDIEEDVYPTSIMMAANNRIYIGGGKQGSLATYTSGIGFQKLGRTSMEVYTMAANPNTAAGVNNIFVAGYPKGTLLQYNPTQNWTADATGFYSANGGFATTSTNPKQLAMFQNADGAGVNGSMVIVGMVHTTNGYVITGGNNDRITASSGRELSMGSYKNGLVRNIWRAEFANYEFQSITLNKDGKTAIIGAKPKSGTATKLFKYDPETNSVTDVYDLQLWGEVDYKIQSLTNDLLVGYCDHSLFIYDLVSKKIISRQDLTPGERIFTMGINPLNNEVFVTHMYRLATNFRIIKYKYNLDDKSNIGAQSTVVTELQDKDLNERSKPCNMLFAPIGASGISDLYISGLNSLYRLKV